MPMRFSRCFLLGLAVSASALRMPSIGRKSKPISPPPAPEPIAPWESNLLKAVATPFFAYPAAIVQSRPVIENVFGLPSTTFEDNLREPAAGFLALYSPLGVLEGCLCLALAKPLFSKSTHIAWHT